MDYNTYLAQIIPLHHDLTSLPSVHLPIDYAKAKLSKYAKELWPVKATEN
jgi:hypothetical protein